MKKIFFVNCIVFVILFVSCNLPTNQENLSTPASLPVGTKAEISSEVECNKYVSQKMDGVLRNSPSAEDLNNIVYESPHNADTHNYDLNLMERCFCVVSEDYNADIQSDKANEINLRISNVEKIDQSYTWILAEKNEEYVFCALNVDCFYDFYCPTENGNFGIGLENELYSPLINDFQLSPNRANKVTNVPWTSILIHTTGGQRDQIPENFIKNSDTVNKVSSHYIILGVGEIIQMVPENKIAFHAKGFDEINTFTYNEESIGIEIANLGYLEYNSNGYYYNELGLFVDYSEVYEEQFFKYLFWHKITDEQLNSLYLLIKDIILRNPSIEIDNIFGHYHKQPPDIILSRNDPGPQINFDKLRNCLENNLNECDYSN